MSKGGVGVGDLTEAEKKSNKRVCIRQCLSLCPSSSLPTPSSLSPYIYTFFWAASNHTMSTVIYRN